MTDRCGYGIGNDRLYTSECIKAGSNLCFDTGKRSATAGIADSAVTGGICFEKRTDNGFYKKDQSE